MKPEQQLKLAKKILYSPLPPDIAKQLASEQKQDADFLNTYANEYGIAALQTRLNELKQNLSEWENENPELSRLLTNIVTTKQEIIFAEDFDNNKIAAKEMLELQNSLDISSTDIVAVLTKTLSALQEYIVDQHYPDSKKRMLNKLYQGYYFCNNINSTKGDINWVKNYLKTNSV